MSSNDHNYVMSPETAEAVGGLLNVCGDTKWNVYNFRSRSVSSQTVELPRCASGLPRQRKRRRGGKKVRARALRRHTALENLLTDATQQPLEFYDSRLSAQAAAVTPVVLPVALLGESVSSAASTAPSPAACSN